MPYFPVPSANPILNMEDCTLCPRECRINRCDGQTGYCGQTAGITVARAALHFWEEPCISGQNGSGAVFFSGCNMRCVFCQNHAIAQGHIGKSISVERLADIFLELQQKGADNINLVTPTHFIPRIIEALQLAKAQDLSIPIVYNSSGYEKVEALKCLDGLIDIYLPDLKYYSSALSTKYSNAPDYFETACAAIAEMVRQAGTPLFESGEDSLMKKGVIVRHLLLPDCEEDSRYLIKYLHDTYQNDIYVSIMNQYTPLPNVKAYPELDRTISEKEYDKIVDYAIAIGIENGFIQEGPTASESFIPPFDCEGV